MTLGINPLPFDAVVLAGLVSQSGCAPHARARENTRVLQNWTHLFCGCTSGAERQSWRDYFLIFNQQHNQYEFVPVGAAGSGGRCWCGDGRGGVPGAGRGPRRVSGCGQPRERHGRREIYGCKWTRVRVRVRDVLLMGKKLRGSVAVPSGQEEKSVGMPFLAEREGKRAEKTVNGGEE